MHNPQHSVRRCRGGEGMTNTHGNPLALQTTRANVTGTRSQNQVRPVDNSESKQHDINTCPPKPVKQHYCNAFSSSLRCPYSYELKS